MPKPARNKNRPRDTGGGKRCLVVYYNVLGIRRWDTEPKRRQ